MLYLDFVDQFTKLKHFEQQQRTTKSTISSLLCSKLMCLPRHKDPCLLVIEACGSSEQSTNEVYSGAEWNGTALCLAAGQLDPGSSYTVHWQE